MHGRWSCYLVFSFIDIYYIHVYPIVMYGCKSWTIKKVEHRRTDDFELWLLKTLERPLDCKEIKPINPKEISPEYSFWRTDVEAEAPKLRPPDAKNWPPGKGPDARKDWRQEEKAEFSDVKVPGKRLSVCKNGEQIANFVPRSCQGWVNPQYLSLQFL